MLRLFNPYEPVDFTHIKVDPPKDYKRKRPYDYWIKKVTGRYRLIRGADLLTVIEGNLKFIEDYVKRLKKIDPKLIIKRS